jgi:hypothetical protein
MGYETICHENFEIVERGHFLSLKPQNIFLKEELLKFEICHTKITTEFVPIQIISHIIYT